MSMCPCGKPLHYSSKAREYMMLQMVRQLGETVPVSTPAGKWAVPRHFIALHGFEAGELPALAQRYGFKKL